jgi:ATP-dependent DNA helicase RecG
MPKWQSDKSSGVTLTFFAPEVTPEVKKVIDVLLSEMSRQEIQEQLKLKDDEHFRKTYLLPALNAGFIEMTVPDKPNSRMQKHRVTKAGKNARGAEVTSTGSVTGR